MSSADEMYYSSVGGTKSGVPVTIIPIDKGELEHTKGFLSKAEQKADGRSPVENYLDRKWGTIRQFDTGATRSPDDGKPDFEGYLSPLVIERYGEYMTVHRHQSDGTLRASDNWQKGIPRDQYLKSAFRHLIDVWVIHRGHKSLREKLEDSLCAVLFNISGYLHETLKERGYLD